LPSLLYFSLMSLKYHNCGVSCLHPRINYQFLFFSSISTYLCFLNALQAHIYIYFGSIDSVKQINARVGRTLHRVAWCTYFWFSIWSEFSGTRAKAIFHRNGTHDSGYFGQLLSAVAATAKTHLHARVSSSHDSAGSYLAALSAPNKYKVERARPIISLIPVIT